MEFLSASSEFSLSGSSKVKDRGEGTLGVTEREGPERLDPIVPGVESRDKGGYGRNDPGVDSLEREENILV